MVEAVVTFIPPIIFIGVLIFLYSLVRNYFGKPKLTKSEPISHYTVLKSQRRKEEFKEWDNDFISLLQDCFFRTYHIPYNEAQLAYVAYNNYTQAKKAIDVIGDRAYWFDDCPRTKSSYSNDYENSKVESPYREITVDNSGRTEIFHTSSYDTLSSNLITADKIYVGKPRCSCESCDFNAKMDSYNHCKRVWDYYKLEISNEYPDFLVENLKDFKQLEIGTP